MNFDLSEEQKMLRDAAQKFLRAEYRFDARNKIVASEPGMSRELWQRFGEFGWLSVALPEADAGFGGGMVETIQVAEALGAALVVEPYLASAVLGAQALARAGSAAQIFLPEVPGWQRVDFNPVAPWDPRAGGADHRLLGAYADRSGHRIDVFYALYATQAEGREAGGFGQGALIPDGTWSWSRNVGAPAGGKGEVLVYQGATERLAHTWYRSGKALTGSNARLKLAVIGDRLLLRARPTAVLILSSECSADTDPAASLAAFEAAVGEIGPWMDRIGEPR